MNAKIEYLKMIEQIIDRMAKNSFQLKGWAVSLATLIVTLTVKNGNSSLAVISIIPLIAFWALDAYYLQLERMYKELYKIASARAEEQIDFCMDTSYFPRCGRLSYWWCFSTVVEAGFYLPITVAIIITLIVFEVL